MSRYTLEDVRREYDRLDRLCGVDTRGIELKVSKRASKRYGSCRSTHNVPERITITDFILDCEEAFWDVIRHEYAHALVMLRYPRERHGHDAVWKAACREVGCHPSASNRSPEADALARTRAERRINYVISCRTCGHIWQYMRKPKYIRMLETGRPTKARCPYCGGRQFSISTRRKDL